MSTINYSDVFAPILSGANRDKINLHNGYLLCEAVGYAKITSTLQSNIPVFLPSQAQAPNETLTNPDKALIIPAGAIIVRHGLRLPRSTPASSRESNPVQYGNLQPNATLIGTTGELIKVAPSGTYTSLSPSIACVASAYTPDSNATVQRGLAAAADATQSLVTTASPLVISLVVSNAGSTAAGNGIATSSGEALAIVQVCWLEIQPAITYEMLGFQSSLKK